jgi:hypothetical protein
VRADRVAPAESAQARPVKELPTKQESSKTFDTLAKNKPAR